MAKRKMLMAKRKMLFHPDYVREKIRASQLINRLHKCAFGEISLTMTQLRAIEILLRKCIPDLAAAEIKSEQTRRYVVEVLPVLDRDEWQEKYGAEPELPTAEPTVIWTPGQQSGAVGTAAVPRPHKRSRQSRGDIKVGCLPSPQTFHTML